MGAVKPVNLEDLAISKFQEFIDSFDFVFSDCDGVIWHPQPSKESGKFINLMKKLGKKVHFVSNNSLRSRKQYAEKFAAAGIENGAENLTLPSIAIAEYLKARNFDKYVFCVSCSETENVLKSYGLKCKSGPEIIAEGYGEFTKYMQDDEEIGAVVFDSDFKINLPKMYKAITYLKRPEVIFLNGASDKVISLIPGTISITPVFLTNAAEEVTKRVPEQLGKPGKKFADFAMKRAGATDPSRVLFIGDMIDQDVGLGKVAGFQTLLVLTNLSFQDMMDHEVKPDFYAKDLASLVPKLLDIIK